MDFNKYKSATWSDSFLHSVSVPRHLLPWKQMGKLEQMGKLRQGWEGSSARTTGGAHIPAAPGPVPGRCSPGTEESKAAPKLCDVTAGITRKQ